MGRVASRRLIVLSLVISGVALAGCGGGSHPTAKASAHASAAPTPTPPPGFTDKYGVIHSGMPIDQVRTIMGSPGDTLSQSDNGAGTTSIVIRWQDPKSSKSIIVSFVDNVMTTKSAIGF